MHSSAMFPHRNLIAALMLACAFFVVSPKSYAQGNNSEVTNGGTEFMICFMQNEAASYGEVKPGDRYQNIYVASSGDSATITITCKAFPNWKHIIILGPD